MERRDVLKYTALLTGAAVGAPLAASLLSSCSSGVSTTGKSYKPVFFNSRNLGLVQSLVDTILPETESPSASALGVHHTIDQMVGLVYKKSDRQRYADRFGALKRWLREQSGDIGFPDSAPDRRLSILQELENSGRDDLGKVFDAYLGIKQQTVAYYLSTETISKEYLNYLPVPGEYQPCIELASVDGKAWAI